MRILNNLEIPLPPITEQRAIARILGALDDKIELNRRMNRTLEAMAQALFKSWFVDFDPVTAKAEGRAPFGMSAETAALFPAEFQVSFLGDIPCGWDTQELGELCESAIGGDWGEDKPFTSSVVVPCLRGVDLESLRDYGYCTAPNRWVGESSLAKRQMSNKDVIIAGSGMGPLGRCIWINEHLLKSFETAVVYSNFCKRLTCKEPEIAVYIDRILYNLRISGEIWNYSLGTSIPNLDISGLLKHKVVLPPRGLLVEFMKFYDKVCALLYSKESRTLSAIRDALLPKLLSGKIRLGQAERYVEDAS